MSNRFLGSGLLQPFRRDRKRDFANAQGLDLVRACVAQVLGTQCSDASGYAGEIPWRPEFGSSLYRLRHKKGVVLQELARLYVADALARWEPRVRVSRVDIEHDLTSRTLTIRLRYDVIEQNTAGNNVIFQDVEQAIGLPIAA